MKYIRNDSTDPYYNLALEEYVLNTMKDDDYILLWQNDKTVVIGKHQNAMEEVNIRRAEELGVKVVRRNTGGGAVYHDMGNLNFSFITDWDPETNMDYDMFLKPVIRALTKFGVSAEKQGRNDLVVDGKKISGNAQCIHGGRILHHGTLLIDSDLSFLQEILNVQPDKIVSKGIKSVRSRVANIHEYASSPIGVGLLKSALAESFFENSAVCEHALCEAQIGEIKRLAKEKYETWEWNYGSTADYSYRNARRFPCGKIEVNLDVRNGLIQRCKIYGDFLAITGVEELENAVVGCRADRKELKRVLGAFDLRRYYGITLDELLICFE